MDVYEKGILLGAMPAAIWLGWFWRPLRVLMLVVAARRRCWRIASYQGGTWRAPTGVLAQVLPVQPVGHPVDERAVLHEHDVLLARHVRRGKPGRRAWSCIGSRLAWAAVTMALIGTMVRWYESHLIGAGHRPHPGQQPVRSVRAVLLADDRVLPVLRAAATRPARWAPS